MTDTSDRQRTIDSYAALAGSYQLGLIRLLEAEIAALKAQASLSILHGTDVWQHPVDGDAENVLEPLRKVTQSQFDAFRYLTELSYLVYGTTLLDSFLSDTTKFLFLLFPGAMGKDVSVKLEAVIGAKSREELICTIATKKVREISFLPFLARVEFLDETFGLKATLDPTTVEAVEHYSGLRNVVVHDQSIFDVALEIGGGVVVSQKSCPRHPTPLKSHDLQRAERAYKEVVSAIFEAVVTQIFKVPARPLFQEPTSIASISSGSAPPTKPAIRVGDPGSPTQQAGQ